MKNLLTPSDRRRICILYAVVLPAAACGDTALPLVPSEAMGRACPNSREAEKVIQISLPTPSVITSGQINTNADSIALTSTRSGVQYVFSIDALGRFVGTLPPGRYAAQLRRSEGVGALAAGHVMIEDSRPIMIAACASSRCNIEQHDGDQPVALKTGRLKGQLKMTEPGAIPGLAGDPSGTHLGVISLLPVEEQAARFGRYAIEVAPDLSFALPDLPFGRYRVTYSADRLSLGQAVTPASVAPVSAVGVIAPAGSITFEKPVNIKQAETNWHGDIASRKIRIHVTVNGSVMPDNTAIPTYETPGPHFRGVLILGAGEQKNLAEIALGATGPSVVDVNVIPGRYNVAIETAFVVSHGMLFPREQNVLPVGIVNMGAIDVPPGNTIFETTLDLPVRKVQFLVSQPTAHGTASIDLLGPHGSYVWAALPAMEPILLYAGCQVAAASMSDSHPTISGFGPVSGDVLGEVCIPCDP